MRNRRYHSPGEMAVLGRRGVIFGMARRVIGTFSALRLIAFGGPLILAHPLFSRENKNVAKKDGAAIGTILLRVILL